MNSAHVDPNLDPGRGFIAYRRSRGAQKFCRPDNTQIHLNIREPVINAVLMAPRFQFHARPTYHHACFPCFSARFWLLFGRWLISLGKPRRFPSGAKRKTSRKRRPRCQYDDVFNVYFNISYGLHDTYTYYLYDR